MTMLRLQKKRQTPGVLTTRSGHTVTAGKTLDASCLDQDEHRIYVEQLGYLVPVHATAPDEDTKEPNAEVEELRALAEVNDVDLGNARTAAGIRKKLVAAGVDVGA